MNRLVVSGTFAAQAWIAAVLLAAQPAERPAAEPDLTVPLPRIAKELACKARGERVERSFQNRIVARLTDGWRIEGHEPNHGILAGAYRIDYVSHDALEATVPTTVQNSLLIHGRIPDPYQGFNINETRWIEDREWWFLREFATPEREPGTRVVLRFDGITYRGMAWVNGAQVGRLEGMFRVHEFDVTDLLNAEGTNRLAVRLRTQEDASQAYKGSVLDRIVQAQGVEAQSTYSINWFGHMVPIGIWRPVTLRARGPVWIDFVRIRTMSVNCAGPDGYRSSRGDADLVIEWIVRNDGERDAAVCMEYTVAECGNGAVTAPGRVAGVVKAGTTTTLQTRLKLENVLLWWPNGLGQPNLHRLSGTLRDKDERPIEEFNERFGIRKLELIPNEDEDRVEATSGQSDRPWSNVGRPYPWTFVVNGRRLFMKGSNWVLLDALFRLDRERYDRQLRLVRDGGFNFLRVWGGSLAETDEFYDLCDEYGILCWQDFWFQGPHRPAVDHDLFVQSVRDTAKRLLNRPSLAFHTGGNEFEPDAVENRGLVDKIARAIQVIDPGREFRRGSPYKGDRHGGLVMTAFGTRNKYRDILPGERRIVLFRSEVAVGRSAPMLSSLDKFIPPESRQPLDERLWRHFCGVPFEWYQFANEYDALDDSEDALFANYLAHGLICRYNMEFCRSRMFRCSGNLNWQFNVPWPCLHRAIVDTWGVPQPAYYFYMRAARPRILTLDYERYLFDPGESFAPAVHVVNDGGEIAGLEARVRVFTAMSELLHVQTFRIAAARENASTCIGRLAFTIPDRRGAALLVHTELLHGDETLHSELHWLAISKGPRPDTRIVLDGPWRDEAGREVILPGNDMAQPEDQSRSAGRLGSESASADAVYTRELVVPGGMLDQDLEFFCAGFDASDEVWVNGHLIGRHKIRRARFDASTMSYVRYGGDEPSSAVDPDSEYPFSGDPITLPKVHPRFYDIPRGLLRPGANAITVRLKPRFQKAVAYSLYIQPRTPNRDEVVAYLRNGRFFAELRRMPKAQIAVTPGKDGLRVANTGDCIALMVIVEIIPTATGVALPLSDNAFHLLPGETRRLTPMGSQTLQWPAMVRVYGWRVGSQQWVCNAGDG